MRIIRFEDSDGSIRFGSQQPDGSALRIEGDIFGQHRVTSQRATVRKLESTGSAFKMGGAALSPGLSFIAHNTIFGPGGGLRSVGYGKGPDRGAYVAMSRNNLFAGSGHQDLVNISLTPATTLTTT